MAKKADAIILLYFIMTFAAGLISGPGLPAYAQTPEETDDFEIIDGRYEPDYSGETDELIFGYVPPALPPLKESEPTLMMPEGGFISFLSPAEEFPESYRSDREPWAEGIRMKNQRPAGTCWAFSATTSAEYSYAKQTFGSSGSVTELSPGHLAYFRYNRVDDPLHNTTGDQFIYEEHKKNWPDAGGNQVDAALHLSTWSGPASEKAAPYQKVRDGYSPDDKGKEHWNPDHKPYDDAIAYTDSLILKSFQYVRWKLPAELDYLPDGMTKEEYRENRIRLIKRFLLDYGAVSVSVHMDGKKYAPDYDAETGSFKYFFADTWLLSNHAVTVIGWDDRIQKEIFTHPSNSRKKPGDVTPKIDGAWIVQNSWGEEWGEKGFFYVSYDSRDITWLSDLSVFTLQDPKTYKYNFQYDGSAILSVPDEGADYMPGKKTKAANIFVNTTGVPITVDAVGFSQFEENPADLTISVYTGLKDPADPESGTYIVSENVHTDFFSFQTADLSKKAYVGPGENFSVVFSFDKDTSLGLEKNNSNEDGDEPWYRLQFDPGQSFYKKAEDEWKDMYYVDEGACWRIKAFANPVEEPGGHNFFPITCADCLLPETGFTSVRPTELSARPRELEYSALGMTLQIPRFDVSAELTRIPRVDNSWSVEWLGEEAGVLEGSALPGEGYSVIAAHNTLDSDTYGPFALLASLGKDDRIFIRGAGGELMIFTVYANELTGSYGFTEIASVAENEPGSLVLLTCENESVEGGYMNRRVVFAKPQ